MTDMSVDKLLQKLYDGYESKIHAEILRRYESLKCCGNCKSDRRNCIYWNPQGKFNGYCPQWQSDGLTRAEREGK